MKGGFSMLSENIRRYRLAKNLTQEELADRLHIVRQTVSKWENNRAVPDAEMLVRVAKVLDVPVMKLLGEQREAREATNANKGGDAENIGSIENIGNTEDAELSDKLQMEELSRKLEAINAKIAEEIHKRRLITRIIAAAVGVAALCAAVVALTYYNPTIRYSIVRPLDGQTQYYYEDIHIFYSTKLGLPLPLKYKELIGDFTEKSAAVMKDIRDNYEAPMHIEITVINDNNSMRVMYSGTVTKDGKEQEYINSFWVAGNIKEQK